MEYNSGVSMILPDSISLMENNFDDEDREDIVHEQKNQNEIVELIMAAFEGQDEPSDDDDNSLNTSSSSEHSSDEQQTLNSNNDEQYAQQQQELLQRNHTHQQAFLSTPVTSTSSPTVSTDVHGFPTNGNDDTHYISSQYDESSINEKEVPFNGNNHIVHYHRPSKNPLIAAVQYAPTIDPIQAQFLYQTPSPNINDTQNQLRILCIAKDRKIVQLENLCQEYNSKYESEVRALKHKSELTERAKYDWEQRYQLINTQCEELRETNKKLQRTIIDTELRTQQLESLKTQFEKKLDDSGSLIDSLDRKVKELQQFESIARSQQDYELVLATIREKNEQEIIFLTEKLEDNQMNLQEKNVEVDELRVQLELACKNNEKSIFERMETIRHLNEQLHEYQQKYTDLLTTNSLELFNQTEIQRQLTHLTEDKEKLESTCRELQSEVRTLRERLSESDDENDNDIFGTKNITINELSNLNRNIEDGKYLLDQSLINENIHLKERIDEFALNEKHLIELNEKLESKIQDYEYQSKRSGSGSSSSSNETVITTSIHMERIQNLNKEIEKLKKDYSDLEEKYEYEKHELQTIIEQLREDIIDLDKTKQLYVDVCQEKNSIDDSLRSKFEFDLKRKLDEFHRIMEKEHDENILYYKNNQEKLEQDNQTLTIKYNQDLEQQSKELHQEIDRIKVKHEKQINELNNELDRLRTDDDAKSRLIYMEKEFEQLKHDYYNLNLKQKELINSCSTLENQNQNLLHSIEQIEHEKVQLKQTNENKEAKILNEMKQLNELNEHQKQELISIHKQTDHHQINLKQDIESLQLRIDNYENAISQYEEYRTKLENNLQKITHQRDTNKMDLRLTKEMLTQKEEEYNQLKLRFDESEKHLQINKEQFIQYDKTINDLQREIQELYQARLVTIQENDIEYREKFLSIDAEKCQYEQRLQEANRALSLADSHLEQEISKIKISLEQEYNRLYERDQKQHQHELQQLRQQLSNEFEKPRRNISPINQPNNSIQESEDIKKMYRAEIDRLYRENIELSQHQAKLIDAHQKQMQIMKKELDDGYNNVINEFQREQTRLQTRYDQLKQQLTDSQQIIEQLRTNLNQLKTTRFDEVSKVKEAYTNEKYTLEHDQKNKQENIQNRLDHLVKLLEQSKNALNQERISHAQQEKEHQQTIFSLQRKIADMIKQHTKEMDELKRELHQEHLPSQKRVTSRPTNVPDFAQTDLSVNDMKSEYMATVEKIRVGMAHCMDNLEISIKKQIQNELIRSRNSMIKEIRRELFDKITHALRSQRVPDTTIDMYVFELDRLLSQMAQDCSDSLTASSLSSSSSMLCFQITPQRQQSHPVVNNSSSSPPIKSTTPLRKSIECLYMTPTINKKPAPLAPHYRVTLDNDRRPKSASNVLIASQHSTTSIILSPRTQKFQRSPHKNSKMKMYRSEDDIMLAVERDEQQKSAMINEDEDTLCEDQPNVRALAKQCEQKTNSLPDHIRIKSKTPDNQTIHYAIARTVTNGDDDDELSWPQEQSPTTPTQTSGIKKFVRNGLKLFISQPQQTQQQYKRTGK